LAPARYYCRNCQRFTCDTCTDENPATDVEQDRRCFICSSPVTFLGAAHSVEPFWRRINKIFQYGISKQALIAITVCSICSLIGLYSVWMLLLSSVLMVRYSFNCLEQTAYGNMSAPAFGDSFSGGIQLMLQLIGVVIVAVGALILIATAVGEEFLMLAIMVEVFVLPAVFILLAMNGNLSEALSPSNIGRLIKSTGAAYVIALIFIFILLSSVAIITEMIGEQHQGILFVAQNLVSNFYTVITFHLLGYLVFQKQDALGFYAEDSDVTREPRAEVDIQLAHIEVLVKEGRYQHAVEIYRELLPKHPNNLRLWERCLKLLVAVGSPQDISRFADQFLPRRLARDDEFAIAALYREIRLAAPAYQPRSPDTAVRIARVLFNLGDFREVVNLLNNFHKRHDDKPAIFDAYTLLSASLHKIPSLEHKAGSYEKFLKILETQIAQDREKELKENPLAKFQNRF
jgi:tetratricopeptide (TPR) repeat protein